MMAAYSPRPLPTDVRHLLTLQTMGTATVAGIQRSKDRLNVKDTKTITTKCNKSKIHIAVLSESFGQYYEKLSVEVKSMPFFLNIFNDHPIRHIDLYGEGDWQFLFSLETMRQVQEMTIRVTSVTDWQVEQWFKSSVLNLKKLTVYGAEPKLDIKELIYG